MYYLNQARESLYKHTEKVDFLNEKIEGYKWRDGVNYAKIIDSYVTTGFQATHFSQAVHEIRKMLTCRDAELPETMRYINHEDDFISVKSNCTIFLGYTSNIISSGLRETVRFLVQNKLVDCIVTTAGGVEEDLMKCLAPTYSGSFNLPGGKLHDKGINRTGNLLVPNDNYRKFEEWIMPHLDEMLHEQKTKGVIWSPSKIITRLGEEIDNEESVCYWAAKNRIPIFCPAITDGALGDTFFVHSYKNPGLIIDVVDDVKRINMMAIKAANTGVVIVGGGVVKHHINNANWMRGGSNFAVFLNTGEEYDGSDAGARPDEAISWGKIKKNATPVKIHAEATLILPLLVGETFAKYHFDKIK